MSVFFDLVLNDFRSRYLNNLMGGVWAFVQPVITILIYWFVFTIGFHSAPIGEVPYVLWIITGMIPWFFISEGLLTATNSIIEKDFLVKKVVFTVQMLPAIKVATAFAMQVVFIFIMVLVFLFYGYSPQWSWIQVFYYLFSAIPLVLGISLISSSIIVFFRDLGHIVAMIVQFSFWLTPIMWPITMAGASYAWVLKLNPFYYLIEGYRSSMLYDIWFWENPIEFFQYWTITSVLLFFGWIIFRRLRPHFADVL